MSRIDTQHLLEPLDGLGRVTLNQVGLPEVRARVEQVAAHHDIPVPSVLLNQGDSPFALQQVQSNVDNGVATITINRPESRNAINSRVREGLFTAWERFEKDTDARAAILTGAGDKAFCAGADLLAIGDGTGGQTLAERLNLFLPRLGQAFNRIETSRLPIIAAVNGLTLAGGLELVLCCDLVIAAHPARFGDAHANYGLLPGGGGSVRLPRKIGEARAKHLMMTGGTISAAEMKEAGLVTQLVAPEDLIAAAQALVESLAEKSRPGLAYMKQLVRAAQDSSLEVGLRQELEAMAAYALSNDIVEGLAAFREKRKPDFSDR